jgi:hypothetical protein
MSRDLQVVIEFRVNNEMNFVYLGYLFHQLKLTAMIMTLNWKIVEYGEK